MTVGKYVLFILIPLALQTSLFSHLSLFGVIPNLVLITTVCYGLLQGFRSGLYFGLLAGLCLDLAGSGVLGINIIILGLPGVCRRLSGKVGFQRVLGDSALYSSGRNGHR